ncbi:hypothetical protein LAZ67_2004683 [Cordylochernes scorpioides]|uniref:Peptidase A2 domain-containing protein n=1 Tax=Cordylochernes scorpioides TaxID=51811 RepID=A0ABY6K5H9_9ARAC|nr:hypothetical protein LAZ67_2004683 [Cordylochernes scorpioides]
MEQGREEDPKEPMESDPDSESGENTTFPKKETTLGRTQEVPPSHEDATPPPPVSDVLGSLTRTLHQLSAVTGLSRDVELPRYDGSYEAPSCFTNYDAQADLAQLQYSTRLRKPPNLLQAPLRVTNTRAEIEFKDVATMRNREKMFLVKEKKENDRTWKYLCKHCGKRNHHQERCFFKNAKCYACVKLGHVEAICYRKKWEKVHSIDLERVNIGFISERNYDNSMLLKLRIDQRNLNMKIDSGTGRSIISERTFNALWKNKKLFKKKIALKQWDQGGLKVKGSFLVNVEFGNKKAKLPLLVVTGVGPSLVGRNWFDQLGVKVEIVQSLSIVQQQRNDQKRVGPKSTARRFEKNSNV